MKVWVERPTISGDRVLFRWRQSEPNPFQRANEFFFRYEDLDLSVFSVNLFYEIFLALQLKVFTGYDEPVELIFPDAVPGPSVDFWRAFFDADQVTIGPVADILSYAPLMRASRNPPPKRTAAIFYGGGKDSVLAAGLLSEIFRPREVLLIQYVAPLSPGAERAANLERRHLELMLRPIQAALGVGVQRIWSDYQANFVESGFPLRPHLEFYTAGALPILIAAGAACSSFGATRNAFPILPLRGGGRRYVYRRSRPEALAIQSLHYRRTLRFDHQVTNVNFPFTTAMDMAFLHARYPELTPLAVMCTVGGPDERWCYRCNKCLNYAFYALAAGYVDPRFDYDRMLTALPSMRAIERYAESGVELSQHGNAPWRPDFAEISVHQSVCHALASSNPERLRGRIGPDAAANLLTLMSLFGNRRFENHDAVATDAVEFPRVDLIRRIGAMAAEHFPVIDRLPGPWIHGGGEAIIDFETRMPARTALVAHAAGAEEGGNADSSAVD